MSINYSQGHASLQEQYGSLYKGDTMIPHTYTPAQKALLQVVLESTPKNTADLHQCFEYAAIHHGVTTKDLHEELISNSLFCAWLKDLHTKMLSAA